MTRGERLTRKVVLLGAAGLAGSCFEALRNFENGSNAFWTPFARVCLAVTALASLGWIAFASQRIAGEYRALWQRSRITAVVTGGIALALAAAVTVFAWGHAKDFAGGMPGYFWWIFLALAYLLCCSALVALAQKAAPPGQS